MVTEMDLVLVKIGLFVSPEGGGKLVRSMLSG